MEEISEQELADLEAIGKAHQHAADAIQEKVEQAANKMEEISLEELDEVMKAPQSKPRKPKIMERSYHNWFYVLNHSYAKCSNPDCIDPRGTDSAMVAEVNGKDMCRFCFLAGWNQAESQ